MEKKTKKYIVVIEDFNEPLEQDFWINEKEFDDLEDAIEFYEQYSHRELFAGKITNTETNKVVAGFCNDFD